jgi:ribosomal protein RSM22 (predicted rRNA methylase)
LATFPGVHSLLLVEREAEFGPLAAAFAEATAAAATTIAADLDSWLPDPTRQDLVIASYVLGEIAPAARASLIDRAWASAAGALVLIEPGTPDGYGRVIAARDRLLDLGARVVAPCPHHHVCPLPAGDWCHFSVRLPRRRDHRLAKRAEAPFEDEKFSYVAVTRDLGAPAPARLLRAPLVTKPEARLRFCTPAGIEDRIVPARDRAAYKRARKYRWGDEGED